MIAFHTEEDANAFHNGGPMRSGFMLIFYFSSLAMGWRVSASTDILSSYGGTQDQLREFLGDNQPALTFAIFDWSTMPPTLTYRAKGVKYSFKDARKAHELFPQFYVGEHGDVLDSDSYSAIPVMSAP